MSEPTDTIVLIHGLWMTPLSWEHWIDRFTSRGHKVLAPAWPGMERSVEELRRDPSPMKGLGAAQIVDHYDKIIRGLEQPPIIMGHSFGGSFVQLLLNRGLGSAGVGIDAGTVSGVRDLPLSTLKSAFPILGNPLNRNRATALTAKQFRYAFGNTVSEEESQAAYDRYAVPAANRVLFEGAFASVSPKSPFKVDFGKSDRAPLLFIAGGDDHVVPAKVNRSNARKYAKSSALTEVKEFPGRSHYTVGEPGWEAVADYALAWATEHATRRASVPQAVPDGTGAVHSAN
jgi:pimeloyl-ACP methyl ester carboxylesterase